MKRKIYSLIMAVVMMFTCMTMTTHAASSNYTEDVCDVFTDVKHNAWYEEAVQYVYDNGIMNGSNGTFKPTDNITRAQLVTTLYRLAGSPEVTDYSACKDFSDVTEGKYYTEAVCWAYNEGITTGSNGKFNPSDNLTRQQMIVFLFRYAEVMGVDVNDIPEDIEIYGFGLSWYALYPTFWAVGTGLITGNGLTVDGRINVNPLGTATRAQVATILMRFCETM